MAAGSKKKSGTQYRWAFSSFEDWAYERLKCFIRRNPGGTQQWRPDRGEDAQRDGEFDDGEVQRSA